MELEQPPFASRATDIDDLILNASGVTIGYALFALIRCIRMRSKKEHPYQYRPGSVRQEGAKAASSK